MRRISFVVALLAVVLTTALILGPGRLPTSAQGATPVAGQGFVGAWRVTVTPTGRPPFVTLSAYAADGTVVNSGAPVQPAPPGAPYKLTFGSTGYGAWTRTGADTANVIFVVLQSDEAGHFLGTVTVEARIRLAADGQTWSGDFTTTIANPAGKTVASFAGRVNATRITVQPLPSAAATPGG